MKNQYEIDYQQGYDTANEEWLDQMDKIRAEIEKEIIPKNSDQYDYEAKWQNSGLRIALKIINKYKAESEDED